MSPLWGNSDELSVKTVLARIYTGNILLLMLVAHVEITIQHKFHSTICLFYSTWKIFQTLGFTFWHKGALHCDDQQASIRICTTKSRTTEYFAKVPKGWGVSISYTHTKKNRTWLNGPFAQFPSRALDAPFAQFAPADLKSFRHPGGYPFFTEIPRGVPKFYSDCEGAGMHFLWVIFPKSTILP